MNQCTIVDKCLLITAVFLYVLIIDVHLRNIDPDTRQLSSRVVDTRYGSLRGFISTLPNKHLKQVEVFLGVPYAGAPVGALRFMPPVTSPHWKDVRVVDEVSAVCPQKYPDVRNETDALRRMPLGRLNYLKRLLPHLTNQSEDCLYLNIYVPAEAHKDAQKLPVMMFIHGESYEWNAGNPYDGRVLSSFGNIVVITINYRLGVLGFLPAVDKTARGNYGLMDQVAALHWIQDNIAEFGGDPSNVTIFGQGHGASCVNLLMLSPMARGLFERAIMQSGSALSPWSIARDAVTHTQHLAESLNCPYHDSTLLVECLRKVPLDMIMAVNFSIPDYLTGFGPTVDGIVLPQDPTILMSEQPSTFSQYDLLFGTTRVESYFQFSAAEEKFGIENSRRDRLIRTLVRNLYTYHLQEIFLTIVNEYMDWSRPLLHPTDIFDGTAEAIGDAVVVAPLIRAGSYHAGTLGNENTNPTYHTWSRKTYFYVFGHQTESGDYASRLGCISGEDLQYVFGAPLVNKLSHFSANFSRAEMVLSEIAMGRWANFAKYGDPNTPTDRPDVPNDSIRGRYERVRWPAYEPVHQKYISVSMKPRIRDHYHAHRLSYWLNLIPRFHRSNDVNTSAPHHKLTEHDNFYTYDGIYRKQSDNISTFVDFDEPVTVHTVSVHIPTEITKLDVPKVDDKNEVKPSNSTPIGSSRSVIYSTALTVTIAVGCALLFLNILIFAAIFYQKDKVSLEKNMQKNYYQDNRSDDESSHPSSEKPYMVKDISSSIMLSHYSAAQQYDGGQALDLVQPSKTAAFQHHHENCVKNLSSESIPSKCLKTFSDCGTMNQETTLTLKKSKSRDNNIEVHGPVQVT